MWIADQWKDYEVIDTSKGEKLERWGNYLLVRPDPQVIWDTPRTHKGWSKPNAHYHRSSKGGGQWEFFDLPEQWSIRYRELTFQLKPFSFKHTGLFPEQAANWDWFSQKIKNAGRPIKVLNLFAYTGGATLAAAAAGANVTHVDASKGMVAWAKENARSSGLEGKPVRWLVDDCVKFVEREIRRGSHYDAIIMDPPSYGRGPKGEVWKIEDMIHPLIKLCVQLLTPTPLFSCKLLHHWAGSSCSLLHAGNRAEGFSGYCGFPGNRAARQKFRTCASMRGLRSVGEPLIVSSHGLPDPLQNLLHLIIYLRDCVRAFAEGLDDAGGLSVFIFIAQFMVQSGPGVHGQSPDLYLYAHAGKGRQFLLNQLFHLVRLFHPVRFFLPLFFLLPLSGF